MDDQKQILFKEPFRKNLVDDRHFERVCVDFPASRKTSAKFAAD